MRTNMQSSRGFDDLRAGSQFRLSTLRARASRVDRNAGPVRWHEVRYSRLSEEFPRACPGFNDGPRGQKIPLLCAFDFNDLPVRSIDYADEIDGAHIKHSGWFADDAGYGDRGTVRGIVARLPHGRFLSGYHWSDNDESVLFTDRVFTGTDAARDAARYADSQAERYAETLRADNARFDAMHDAESTHEQCRAEFVELLPARNVSISLRRRVARALKALRAARADYLAKTSDYENGGA